MPDNTRDRAVWTALGKVVDHVRAEPVAFQGVIQTGLAAMVGFGLLSWTAEQTGLALGLTAAILSFLARRRVTPNGRAAGPAADAPTGDGLSAASR